MMRKREVDSQQSNASIAQLAEHALRKRTVVGSIPTGGSSIFVDVAHVCSIHLKRTQCHWRQLHSSLILLERLTKQANNSITILLALLCNN